MLLLLLLRLFFLLLLFLPLPLLFLLAFPKGICFCFFPSFPAKAPRDPRERHRANAHLLLLLPLLLLFLLAFPKGICFCFFPSSPAKAPRDQRERSHSPRHRANAHLLLLLPLLLLFLLSFPKGICFCFSHHPQQKPRATQGSAATLRATARTRICCMQCRPTGARLPSETTGGRVCPTQRFCCPRHRLQLPHCIQVPRRSCLRCANPQP